MKICDATDVDSILYTRNERPMNLSFGMIDRDKDISLGSWNLGYASFSKPRISNSLHLHFHYAMPYFLTNKNLKSEVQRTVGGPGHPDPKALSWPAQAYW